MFPLSFFFKTNFLGRAFYSARVYIFPCKITAFLRNGKKKQYKNRRECYFSYCAKWNPFMQSGRKCKEKWLKFFAIFYKKKSQSRTAWRRNGAFLPCRERAEDQKSCTISEKCAAFQLLESFFQPYHQPPQLHGEATFFKKWLTFEKIYRQIFLRVAWKNWQSPQIFLYPSDSQ